MAYERKYTKEQLIALARERGLYTSENATDEELRELRAKQEAAKRKLALKYAHLAEIRPSEGPRVTELLKMTRARLASLADDELLVCLRTDHTANLAIPAEMTARFFEVYSGPTKPAIV